MGGNLTIFDKDHDTAEIAKVLAAKYTASLQLLYTVSGNQARLDARTEFKILERSPKGHINSTSGPGLNATSKLNATKLLTLSFKYNCLAIHKGN